ncbi:DUF7122 family protein [Halovivax cerinus]|uniref:rRNA small subunit methyltransferase F RNA-binding PUA-like domain-containing protein n=1 Tax=Halovivax cerinus TaxID=1487865 RepID=A0ABD5NP82_9EURY|nr:hypothetical protein [Halovivax cerinus]
MPDDDPPADDDPIADGERTAGDGDPAPDCEATSDDALAENVGERFARLPRTRADRTVAGRVSRADVVEYFDERFGIPPETFDSYTFWEKGAGKIWVYAGEAPSPIEVESLGMLCLRTRQEHWKPTTDFVQRFGGRATECVIDLDEDGAARFVAGDDQELDWDGDWGYLIAAHTLAGEREPLGVGLYVYGELRSLIPKGRRRHL